MRLSEAPVAPSRPLDAARPGSRFDVRQRLRELIREIEARAPQPPRSAPAPASVPIISAPTFATAAAGSVVSAPLEGAARRETAAGLLTYREQRFHLDEHVVGAQPLASLRHADAEALRHLVPDLGRDVTDCDLLGRFLFLDIETTGLGGAGAMVFLVAVAHVEGDTLLMRQYLAESPAEEGALLDALLADIRAAIPDPILVTYNGRTFDAPMLDGRAILHRTRAGFESMPHLDALPPSRLLYRGWLPSCRLAEVEARVLGVTRPSADVDGAEVPAWYFRFLRTGDMRFVEPIASHNLLDVLSLAALTGRLAALVRGIEAPLAGEVLGLGRLLARTNPASAIATLEQTVRWRRDDESGDCGEALWLLARLHKRQGALAAAVPLWHELAVAPSPWSLRAHEELAKFYEHHAHDFTEAARLTSRALDALDRPGREDDRWRPAFRHRLQRLTSRMDRELRKV